MLLHAIAVRLLDDMAVHPVIAVLLIVHCGVLCVRHSCKNTNCIECFLINLFKLSNLLDVNPLIFTDKQLRHCNTVLLRLLLVLTLNLIPLI